MLSLFIDYKVQINMIQLYSDIGTRYYTELFNTLANYMAVKVSKHLNSEVIIVEDLQIIVDSIMR